MALSEAEGKWLTELISNAVNSAVNSSHTMIDAALAKIPGIILEAIKTHVELCPHGRRITKWTYIIAGVALGLGIALGAGSDDLIKALTSAAATAATIP